MHKSTQLVAELLPLIDAYAESTSTPTVQGFVEFVRQEQREREMPQRTSAIGVISGFNQVDTSISFHVVRLSKYAKYYVKEALKDLPLLHADDFAFLASLLEKGAMRKTDLIAYNVAEVPSGMEIIKRLVAKNLMAEVVNPHDRREKIVEITPAGRATFIAATQQMAKVGKVVGGNLSAEQKHQLVELLTSLDHFHEHIYATTDTWEAEKVAAKYL